MTLTRLKKILGPLFRKKKVNRAILFGSFARETKSKRSDIDILIVKKTKKRFLDRFEDFDEIYSLLKNFAVDLLVYTPDEFERNAQRPFLKRIISEGVELYEH